MTGDDKGTWGSPPTADLEPDVRSDTLGLPDRYQALDRLGEGGFGEVWRVEDTHLKRFVTCKITHFGVARRRQLRRHFETEARLIATLQHPGIVQVHDLGVLEDGRLWFTMRVVEGATLHEVAKTWPTRRLVQALASVAEVVAFAHSKGVVHRDLKPTNVMTGSFGQILVLDWGIAKLLDEVEATPIEHTVDHGETQAGQRLGTPAYMAPEQAAGTPDRHGPWSDVFALGACLHQVLTGRPPQRHGVRILTATDRPGVPQELHALVERALSDRVRPARQRARVRRRHPGMARRDRTPSASPGLARGDRVAAVRRARSARAVHDAARASRRAPGRPGALGPNRPEVAGLGAAGRGGVTRRRRRANRDPLHRRTPARLARGPHPGRRRGAPGRPLPSPARGGRAGRRRPAAAAVLHAPPQPRHPGATHRVAQGTVRVDSEPSGALVELERYEPIGRRLEPRSLATLGTTPLGTRPSSTAAKPSGPSTIHPPPSS
ncbi:MAG: serine/threonine protein kinase [Proteobacteria bacterium]|nr:serine/threonine protein kinase [Pseudomonadota bacterium]